MKITVLEPTVPASTRITKDDVFGKFDDDHNRLTYGMIVARSEQPDPIFGGKLPYKSVTVVFPADMEDDVVYWLEYVLGGGCVSERAGLQHGRTAIRADYMAW